MDIEYLPHTADIRMKIRGSTLEELFCNGLKGMNHILQPDFCAQDQPFDHSFEIRLASFGKTNLLVDFLSDVLSHSYTENLIYCRIEIEDLSEDRLQGWLFGAKVESFHEEIKAVTYHEADVKKNSEGDWETVIVFDI